MLITHLGATTCNLQVTSLQPSTLVSSHQGKYDSYLSHITRILLPLVNWLHAFVLPDCLTARLSICIYVGCVTQTSLQIDRTLRYRPQNKFSMMKGKREILNKDKRLQRFVLCLLLFWWASATERQTGMMGRLAQNWFLHVLAEFLTLIDGNFNKAAPAPSLLFPFPVDTCGSAQGPDWAAGHWMNGSDHTNWWEIMIVNTLHRALPVMGFHLLWKDFPMAMNGAEQEVIKTNPSFV